MVQLRSFVLAVALAAVAGCTVEGPQRASDIQNLNGISDDISAVTMTESEGPLARDPNYQSTIPSSSETSGTP